MKGQTQGGLVPVILGLGIAGLVLIVVVYVATVLGTALNDTTVSNMVSALATQFQSGIPLIGVVLIMTLLTTVLYLLINIGR